eukprot:Pompholyxophrys_punicea_v1_NODE_1257_length_834_cov_8.521181.p2 type:complete len:105 gc:universal NODE_1257_length_834_cov_8.521181:198-512(+)
MQPSLFTLWTKFIERFYFSLLTFSARFSRINFARDPRELQFRFQPFLFCFFKIIFVSMIGIPLALDIPDPFLQRLPITFQNLADFFHIPIIFLNNLKEFLVCLH